MCLFVLDVVEVKLAAEAARIIWIKRSEFPFWD